MLQWDLGNNGDGQEDYKDRYIDISLIKEMNEGYVNIITTNNVSSGYCRAYS